MRVLAVLLIGGEVTAAAASPQTPVWAYLLAAAIPVILGGRWYINRKLSDAQAGTEIATAVLTEQQAEQIQEELRLSVLESVRTDMSRQREETARAQASEKEAIAEVAILIAQHARDRAEWRDAKHQYEGTIREQANQITLLRSEVEGLREEVQTLRVALGIQQGRRIDDDRLGRLESDMAAEQARNKIEERGDDDTAGPA